MYCRKCGNPIDNKTVFCKICGEKIIKLEQKSYEEKYLEKKKKEKNAKSDLKKQDKYCDLKNPYVIPAITVSCTRCFSLSSSMESWYKSMVKCCYSSLCIIGGLS